MSEAQFAAGPSGARQRSYWLLLAGGGLLLGGAVALYAWTNTWVGPVRGTSTGPHAGIWVGRSRRLARLTGIYALVALVIGGWLASVPDYVLMFWPALTPQPWHLTPLDALLGPAAVLIAAGIASRWRGRRPGPGRLLA